MEKEIGISPVNSDVRTFDWSDYKSVRVKKNSIVQTSPQLPIMFLVEGSVLATYSSESYDQAYNSVLRGPAILSFDLEGDSKPVKISSVMESCEVVQINSQELADIVANDRDRFQYLMDMMLRQYRRLDERMDELLTKKDAELRLLRFLENESQRYGVTMGNTTFLRLPLSHRQIADVIFACRQSVSSTLSHLRRLDLIAYDRKSMTISRDRFDAYLKMKTKEHEEISDPSAITIKAPATMSQMPVLGSELKPASVNKVAVA